MKRLTKEQLMILLDPQGIYATLDEQFKVMNDVIDDECQFAV